MIRKAGLLSLLLLAAHGRLAAVDVLLSEVAVLPATPASSAAAAEMNSGSAVSRLLHAELGRRSTDALQYRSMLEVGGGSLSSAELISNELQALAACVFYRVPAVLYGSILVDTPSRGYVALMKVYSRDAHAVILEVRQTATAPDVEAFVRDLAAASHQQLAMVLLAGVGAAAAPPAAASAQAPQPSASPPAPAAAAPAAPPAALPPAPPAAAAAAAPAAADVAPAPPPLTRGRFAIGLHAAGGYFFALQEEWADVAEPQVMIEGGVKTSAAVFSSRDLDLRLRSGLLFNYAFSANQPRDLVVHFHSLTPRIPLELCLAVKDRMSFWIGGGPEFRVDIIDHENSANTFVTDISFAFGVFGSLGAEVLVGKQRSIAIGVSNEIDLAFFSEQRIRYGLLLGVTVLRPPR